MSEQIHTDRIFEGALDTDQDGKRWEDYSTIKCPDGQIIDMDELLDEQYRACAALTHLAPFLGGFIGKLQPIYTFRVKTQATDGEHLFVNPQFTYNLDLTGKVFVLAHEILHCLLNHMRRGKGHDQTRSNIAADFEVNATLVDIGLIKEQTMKSLDALIDMKFRNMGYEAIYDEVTAAIKDAMDNSSQAAQAQKNSGGTQSSSKQSGAKGDGDGSGSGNGSNQDNDDQQYSDDYKAGWAAAIADYQAGKIKL